MKAMKRTDKEASRKDRIKCTIRLAGFALTATADYSCTHRLFL